MTIRLIKKDKKDLVVGLVIIIIFAITYSYLIVSTLDSYRSHEYLPDWHDAHWIKAGETSGSGYFRKQVNISSLPNRAYIVGAGTDELSAYINGKYIGKKYYFGTKVTGIFDVTSLLREGENLLAIKIDSDTLGVAPELILRLLMLDYNGNWHEVVSDQTWRTFQQSDFQHATGASWFSLAYKDYHWPHAELVTNRAFTPVTPLAVPEYVFKSFPRGDWIWFGDEKDSVFSNVFNVDGDEIYDAWLGVSTQGWYSLLINGVPVVSQYGNRKTMNLINIGPYVQLGENSLWIEVESEASFPKLLVSGSVSTDVGITELDTTNNWKSYLNPDTSNSSKQQVPVFVWSNSSSDKASPALNLIYKAVEFSEVIFVKRALIIFKYFLFILLISFVMFVLFYRLYQKYMNSRRIEYFTLFFRPYLLGLLVVGLPLLLRFDLSLHDYFLLRPYMLLLAPAVILLFEVLIVREIVSDSV